MEYLQGVSHAIPSVHRYYSNPTLLTVKELLEPFNYVWQLKGKGVRTVLLEGFNLWLKVPAETLKMVGNLVAVLHNASLM
jgi:hypothetical protein